MLEKISFPRLLEQWKNLPPIKEKKVYTLWVKKFVSSRDWKNLYSLNSSYCFLKKEEKGIWVGFMVANPELPNGKLLYPPGVFLKGALPLTDEEALQVDNYRRAMNIGPFPCTILA